MNYPLFISYKGAIIGNGFVAEIAATGRVLATIEPEGCWLYGVNPGAIAVDGASLDVAHLAIRETLRLVFVDFAQVSPDFDTFKAHVDAFFNETDADSVQEWESALAQVRASKSNIGLPLRSADTTAVAITVRLLPPQQLTPALNVPALNAPAPTKIQTTPCDDSFALAEAA